MYGANRGGCLLGGFLAVIGGCGGLIGDYGVEI